jgi:hypothetical protein
MANNKPIWFNQPGAVTEINIGTEPKYKIFVATPVHSECSIHYTQALLKFQQDCINKGILVSFTLYKSSLVTQGRNLCVAEFLNADKEYTHFLFIDSDIDFNSETIFKMIKKDKDIIAVPYPMKWIDWAKIKRRTDLFGLEDPNEIAQAGFTYPIKLEGKKEVIVEDGVAEITHAPTGCMLIKRKVLTDMIDHYPELEIIQPTLVNGVEIAKPNFYNLFDTYHEPETKRFYGEDFGFCKRWTNMGGKIHMYCMDYITHVGEYQYSGRFWDELQASAKGKKLTENNIDVPNKIT